MPEDSKDASHVDDPMSYMVSVAIELHEMKKALVDAGFTSKEALFLIGQAVAAGVMLPINEFGPDDMAGPMLDDEDDDEDFLDDGTPT